MRVAPDFQFKLVEYGGIDIQAEDPDIRNQAKAGPAVDRVRSERIVVPGQNDNWFSVLTEHLTGAFKQFDRLPMVVESVASKHHLVSIGFRCGGEHFGQNC